MNQILKIALLQIAPCNTLEENCKKGLAACRRARKMSNRKIHQGQKNENS